MALQIRMTMTRMTSECELPSAVTAHRVFTLEDVYLLYGMLVSVLTHLRLFPIVFFFAYDIRSICVIWCQMSIHM